MNDTDQSAETDDATPRRRRWVWYAGWNESESDATSMLAIVETVLAVGLYWWAAVHFETYWFLFSSMVVAPFVLLRSPRSQALGVRWFYQWKGNSDRAYAALSPTVKFGVWVTVAITGLMAFVTALVLVHELVPGVEEAIRGSRLLRITNAEPNLSGEEESVVVAVVVTGAVAVVVAGAGTVTAVVAGAGTVAAAITAAITAVVTVLATVLATVPAVRAGVRGMAIAGALSGLMVATALAAQFAKSRERGMFRMILLSPFS